MNNIQAREITPIELTHLPEQPLISVLLVNYNYSRYIGEAIESALNQTYTHFEVIICDDGSTDNSCEVIETYVQKDPRLKLVRKQNGGVASAINAAYKQSIGQIVCILDADDAWVHNKLQKVLEAFKSDPQCGFVIHNVIQIDGHGKFIKPTPMLSKLASGWMAPSALENGGWVDNIPPASALCVRREVADLIFPLNEAFVRNADSIIFRIAPFVTVIGSVSEVLSMYRLHGANLSSFSYWTAEAFEREKNVWERVHQEQKSFLTKVYGAEVAEKLTDLNFSLIYRQTRYLLARLKSAPKSERSEAHRQLLAHPQFKSTFVSDVSQPKTWLLLRWAEYLPDALFATLFHQIYGGGPLKRIVRLIRWGVFSMGGARQEGIK